MLSDTARNLLLQTMILLAGETGHQERLQRRPAPCVGKIVEARTAASAANVVVTPAKSSGFIKLLHAFDHRPRHRGM